MNLGGLVWFSFFLLFLKHSPIKAAFSPTSTLRECTQRGFKGHEISIQETWCQAFPAVMNSTSFMEETDSNPGEGNEGKGSCVEAEITW